MSAKTHSYDDAYAASLKYFHNNELATNVFLSKYALKDDKGRLLELTPDDMHRRIAKEFARIEKNKFSSSSLDSYSEEFIFRHLKEFRSIIPQGSPMFGIGNNFQTVSISNCFLSDIPEDSYAGILRVDQQLIQLSKRRGGVGTCLSKLRPKGMPTKNSARNTTGIIPFAIRYSNSIREVGQCLHGDSIILTKRGMLKIKDVLPYDSVWTKIGWVAVNNVLRNGKKRVYKVITKSGFEIVSSKDHIYQTFDGFGNLTETRLSDLVVGDNIVLCRGGTRSGGVYDFDLIDTHYKNSNYKPSGCVLPKRLDEKLAYLLGFFYGNGSVEYNHHGSCGMSFSCGHLYPKVEEKLVRYIYEVFSYAPWIKRGDGAVNVVGISNKTIVTFLRDNDLLKEKSFNITFPDKILKSSPNIQVSFLSGYFDADGYASGKKKGYCFSSTSLQFLKKCQLVLMSFGILSKIHSESCDNQNWHDIHSLCIVGRVSQQILVDTFIESIKIKNKKHVSKRDNWLSPFRADSFNIKYWNYSFCPDNSQYLSLSVLERLRGYGESVCSNLVVDSIDGISEVGEHETYDLCLDIEHFFWCNGFYVHNSGRRGALMLSCDIRHPESVKLYCKTNESKPYKIEGKIIDGQKQRDIVTNTEFYNPDDLDFCSMKLDPSVATGANLSIKITNEFLDCVKNNKTFIQRWPVECSPSEAKITKEIDARRAWEKIIHCAWQRAEPGILFWDNIINNSPSDCYSDVGYETKGTNPCQPSWAVVATPNGLKKISDIHVGDLIWSKNGWSPVINKLSSGVKKVFEYRTTAGRFFGTEEHKLVTKGIKKEARECDNVDIFSCQYSDDIKINPQDVIDGLVFGDGSYHADSNNLIILYIGSNDKDYFTSEISEKILKHCHGIDENAYTVDTTFNYKELPKTYLRRIPDRFYYGDRSKVAGFLRGLYSANGSICGDRVTLKTSSLDVVFRVQDMLSFLGICSYYTTNKSKHVLFSNGDFVCRESYDLNIFSDKDKFRDIIGFIQNYKNEKLNHSIINRKYSVTKNKNYPIKKINFISEEEVFDITIDNASHTYWTGCCDVSNCGEIPLSPLDSCRLLVINIMGAVVDAFKENSHIDYDKFFQLAYISQRLMDDMIDLELEKIDDILSKINSDPEPEEIKREEYSLWTRIREACENGRRTGLGITGLGDALAAIGLKYGSDEAISETDKIYKTLKLGAYRSSVDMAKAIGHFPVWNFDKEKNNPFLLQIKKEDNSLYLDMKKYGRRNISLLTTAPTGSVSIVACVGDGLFGTTSGIEPNYSNVPYIKKKKINPHDESATIDSTDQNGDHWQHFKVYPSGIKLWMKATGKEDISLSPYHLSSAEELDWKRAVIMQSAAQKHVDHSISRTINVPFDTPENKISEIYYCAWEYGLKGITVYRDSCRTGVLVKEFSLSERPIELHTRNSPSRPKELPADIHILSIKGDKFIIAVGLYQDQPYEVFGGEANGFGIKKTTRGVLTKIKQGQYGLSIGDIEIDNFSKHFTPQEQTLFRSLSTMLRHGIPIEFIVEQMQKSTDDMFSMPSAVARVLKKYIKEGQKATGQSCPSCSSSNIVYQEGCLTCKDCGWSKCG